VKTGEKIYFDELLYSMCVCVEGRGWGGGCVDEDAGPKKIKKDIMLSSEEPIIMIIGLL
jgi:hypothetical protein